MNARWTLSVALVLALASAAANSAEPESKAEGEIALLLEHIADSGCGFNRDGVWYGSTVAYYHLRDKYEAMREVTRVFTAEDFIAKVASVSDATLQPYQVRCKGAPAVSSSQWLHAELARMSTRISSPLP